MKFFKLDKKYSNLLIELIVISVLYIMPIILVDMYYNDDLSRSLGYTGWNGDGRPLCEALIVILSGGNPIVDIAPLSLLLSVVILSYALTLYARKNIEPIHENYLQVMVLLFILINPFAIANLSYRFDCISMYLALSIVLFMYSIPDEIPKMITTTIYGLLSIIIMCLYQPCICLLFVLFLTNIFLFCIGKKKNISAEGYKLIGIIGGGVLYKLEISGHFIKEGNGDWRYSASKIVDLDALDTVIYNAVDMCQYIKKNIMGTSNIYIIALFLLLLVAFLSTIIYYTKENKWNRLYKTIGFVFVIISPVLVFIATFLPLVFLEKLGLKSRILISFGGFLFFIGIMLLCTMRKYKVLWIFLCVVCILYQFTFMYAYANALKSQNEYSKYMVYNIAHDIETINAKDEFSTVTIVGNMPKSMQAKTICDKYPLINELVPIYIDNSTWIGGRWLLVYMQKQLSMESANDVDIQIINTGEPVMDNYIYSCYTNEQKIIIYFKE